jgi:hypothetical protein
MTGCIDISKIAAGLGAMLTPLIAIITVVILVLQYLLAARTWTLALYEKRYAVFRFTMEYITSVVQDTTMTADRLSRFLAQTRESEFLFHQEIDAFMKTLHSKGNDLLTTQSDIKAERDEAQRAKYVETHRQILNWFGDQLAVATRRFGRYLRV